MAKYKITFTPVEPWFFGNEKSFSFPGQENGNAYSNQYFIKSETMPSQSTILGALRYLLIPTKKPLREYTEKDMAENRDYIGEESFNIDYSPKADSSEQKQSFGKIKSISPVVIIRDDEILIPAPMDHVDNGESGKTELYRPFQEYCVVEETQLGKKLYVKDYDAKKGVFNGFVSLKDKAVYSEGDIINSEIRVGNQRFAENEGFFKKEYKYFSRSAKEHLNYSFAVYADLDIPSDDDFIKQEHTVMLGQGKSTFVVKLTPTDEDLTESVRTFLRDSLPKIFTDSERGIGKYNYYYCLSDTLVLGDPYKDTLFAVTQTRDYRAYMTRSYGKIKKGSCLHRMIKAGSVFVTDRAKNGDLFAENKNAEQIGFNTLIKIGENENE
ncbi:MAG: type III-B CRISPR module-associated protein Cmr3 [Faecalibacterium sp.]|nr:type III-B CRISPR module-associated protein Cmr3 [Ruminococcus sp.]MCM1392536.1 type III-B CRISPR module-associated protein Cmr3 [Ruminococcus sp.]MCM1486426.1 type III-B CRISPR module-associated protein Cmr3 [Faecalibacterium sp.]